MNPERGPGASIKPAVSLPGPRQERLLRVGPVLLRTCAAAPACGLGRPRKTPCYDIDMMNSQTVVESLNASDLPSATRELVRKFEASNFYLRRISPPRISATYWRRRQANRSVRSRSWSHGFRRSRRSRPWCAPPDAKRAGPSTPAPDDLESCERARRMVEEGARLRREMPCARRDELDGQRLRFPLRKKPQERVGREVVGNLVGQGPPDPVARPHRDQHRVDLVHDQPRSGAHRDVPPRAAEAPFQRPGASGGEDDVVSRQVRGSPGRSSSSYIGGAGDQETPDFAHPTSDQTGIGEPSDPHRE